jgi:hypothetical protein
MYDSRYAHDVAELEYIAGEEGDPECDPSELMGAHPFPEYVVSYCGRQYGVKTLAAGRHCRPITHLHSPTRLLASCTSLLNFTFASAFFPPPSQRSAWRGCVNES